MGPGAHWVDAASFTLTSPLSKTKRHKEDSNSRIVNSEDTNPQSVSSRDSTLSPNLPSVHEEQGTSGTRQGDYKSNRPGYYLRAATAFSPSSSTSLHSPVLDDDERSSWTVKSSNYVQATTFNGSMISLKKRKRSAKLVVCWFEDAGMSLLMSVL